MVDGYHRGLKFGFKFNTFHIYFIFFSIHLFYYSNINNLSFVLCSCLATDASSFGLDFGHGMLPIWYHRMLCIADLSIIMVNINIDKVQIILKSDTDQCNFMY